MSDAIRAVVYTKGDGGKGSAELTTLTDADLPDEDVLVDIDYSTVNYKDGLAVTGASPICRKSPMVCGIDLAGTVSESSNPNWKPGDRVLINGYGLSELHWGGYAQRQRVNGDFLVRIPEAFGAEQAMALGTAGYTAMLAVNAIRDAGIEPASGPVLVTGAAGGVGSVSLMLLSALGYEAVAATGRPEQQPWLESVGASRIVPRAELQRDSKPLEQENWAGCVDSVGDQMLATVLAQMKYGGVVASCGLAGGLGLKGTVMPFLLRGVRLQGIDSVMAPHAARERAWKDLGELIKPDQLATIYSVEPLDRVPELAGDILAGKVRGRVVIDVNA